MKSKKMILKFSKDIWNKPIVYKLIKEYNLVVNILKANVLPRQESYLVLELTGTKEDFDLGLEYLKDSGVVSQPIDQEVRRNNDVCIHCGACTAVCPTKALYVTRPSMKVEFKSDKCSACELCVPACPPQAMEVSFQ